MVNSTETRNSSSASQSQSLQQTADTNQSINNGDIISVPCTSCTNPISSCFDACLHPLLAVLVCKRCHDVYGDGDFSVHQDYQDQYGDENYCRWCVDGGELLVCGNMDIRIGKKCRYAFCKDCIKRNLPNWKMPKHSIAFPFVCFACDPSPLEDLRKASVETVKRLSREQPSHIEADSDETDEVDDYDNIFNHNQQEDEVQGDMQCTTHQFNQSQVVHDSTKAIPLPGPHSPDIAAPRLPAQNYNNDNNDMDILMDAQDISSGSEHYVDTVTATESIDISDQSTSNTTNALEETNDSMFRLNDTITQENNEISILSDDIPVQGDCLESIQTKKAHDELDADAYFNHLKKDDLAFANHNPRVFNSQELTKLLDNIKEDKKSISDHHTSFFDRLMEECQACIDGQLDQCAGKVLLTLMRDQSFIEVKNLLIMYRKIDSLIESLPID